MYFPAVILTSVLAASTLVRGAPMHRRADADTKMMTDNTKLNAAGAVYCECLSALLHPWCIDCACTLVITNEEDQNRIIAATINSDGTLVCMLE